MGLQSSFKYSGWLNVSNFMRQGIPNRRSSTGTKRAMSKCSKTLICTSSVLFATQNTYSVCWCVHWFVSTGCSPQLGTTRCAFTASDTSPASLGPPTPLCLWCHFFWRWVYVHVVPFLLEMSVCACGVISFGGECTWACSKNSICKSVQHLAIVCSTSDSETSLGPSFVLVLMVWPL